MATSGKRKPTLEDALAMVKASNPIALDLETTSLDPREGRIRLVQVSNGDRAYVIDCNTKDVTQIVQALASKTVIAHGADFEWRWLYHHYGVALEHVRDTLLMARVLAAGDKTIPCGLGPVAERLLGIELDKEMQTSDWRAWPLSKRQIAYASQDARVLLPLYRALRHELDRYGLAKTAAIENAALPSVALMRYEGMPVDKEAWDAHAGELEGRLRALEREMLELPNLPPREPIPQDWCLQGEDCLRMLHACGFTDVAGTAAKDLKDYQEYEIVDRLLAYRKAEKGPGRDALRDEVRELAHSLGAIKPAAPALPWNFNSPDQVHKIAYELLGHPLRNTEAGTLLRYAPNHPFFEKMLEYRSLKKQVSTYGTGWFQEAYEGNRGRVYPGWWQIGTSTGRFASGERGKAPNAQNLPAEHRKFFVAPAGRTFVDMDYSQLEIRILAKYLGVEALLELFEDGTADIYKNTAAGMLNIPVEEVSGQQRQLAKAIMLGMSYGLSAAGLPEYAWSNFGIEDMTPEDAEAHVESFYDVYPEIAAYHESIHAELYGDGSFAGEVDQRTMIGRLRAGITVRNEAINAPIQGTAADGLKLAMAYVHRRLQKFGGTAFIAATIHDELLVECDEADGPAVAEIVKDAMLEAMNRVVNRSGTPVPIEVTGSVTDVWTKD